jgi:hypothetical protein
VGSTPTSYSGDPGFISRPEDWLSSLRLFLVFFSPSRPVFLKVPATADRYMGGLLIRGPLSYLNILPSRKEHATALFTANWRGVIIVQNIGYLK